MDKWKYYVEYLKAVILLIAGVVLAELPDKIGWVWTIAVLILAPLIFILLWNLGENFWSNIWSKILRKVKWWRKTPKIKYWFTHSENDLKLRIQNPSSKKKIDVQCTNNDFLTIRGKRYIAEYRHELKLVRNSRMGTYILYQGTLAPKEVVEITIGASHNGKLALHLLSGDSPVHGFRDGQFEYVISLDGKYTGLERKFYPFVNFSLWLKVKDGVLIRVKDAL